MNDVAKLRKRSRSKVMTIRMYPELWERITADAEKRNLTPSAMARRTLAEHYAEQSY